MQTAFIILTLAIAILVPVIVEIGNKTRDARRDELVQEIDPEIAPALEKVSAYYNYSHYITESERTALSNKYEVLGKNLKKVCGTRQLMRSPEWAAADRLYKALSNTGGFKMENNRQFIRRELERNREFFDTVLKYPLDAQQREAIVSLEDNVLVISSAGSGKTMTTVGGRKIGFRCQSADLRLADVPYRKHCHRQLFLSELAEEIALVLIGVGSGKNAPYRLSVAHDLLSVRVQCRFLAAIMSGRHQVRSHFPGCLQEGIEFNLTIAEDIRIRRPAFRIFIEHIIHHALPVFIAQVNEIERDTDFPGYHFRDETVFLPFAVAVQCTFGVVPILHEHGEYVIALTLQKKRRHAGVHAA